MPFMDTHCHLDFDVFDSNREALLAACSGHQITSIIVPGVKSENWSACLGLAESYEMVSAALGLHPYFMSEHVEEDLSRLLELLSAHQDVVAVGEIGLDDTFPDFDKQCAFFEAQLDIAESLSMPVIMHMRRHHGHGLIRAKKRSLVGGVVHAFSGSYQDAMAWVDLGMKIGVGGIITYDRASKTRDTIAKLPLSSLVLETDAPDMTVQGVKKGRGSPLMLTDIFQALCKLRAETPGEIEQVLWENSKALFGKYS